MLRYILFMVCIISGTNVLADSIKDSFQKKFGQLAREQDRFAIAAGFALENNAPITFVSGKRYRGAGLVGGDAPWHIGSITKSFTSVLVMRLFEQGKLRLDDPIGPIIIDIAPDMHADWQAITLRQLLSHTSGVPANVSVFHLRKSGTSDPSQDRIERLKVLWTKPLNDRAGQFEYSNVGYVLAGVIVEHVTGAPWEQLVVSEVTQPFGLNSAGFGAPTHASAAWGHRQILGFQKAMDPNKVTSDNAAWMGPAGRLHLSMDDLLRWGQLHLSACKGRAPDFLTQESCIAMRTPNAADYGLGWVIHRSPEYDAALIWHNGSNTMWYTAVMMVPKYDLVIAMATNTRNPKLVDDGLQDLMVDILETL